MRNFWIGYYHARDNYARFKGAFLWSENIAGAVARLYPDHSLHVVKAPHNATPLLEWALNLPETTAAAVLDPKGFLLGIINKFHRTWVKKPLWIEMGVTGTDVAVTVRSGKAHPGLGDLQLTWHRRQSSEEVHDM